ncbi:hypothetical protein K469DRAFT_738544 [Zopfia rhizophila CBS 207.26]|uniref:Uncharacterized protein n=1 Tax=Zopfia rhizophila CBS 207.26 TaxID=1314779 RepID=A0A6A6E6P7_9PEZI|nr:hypothetical protein K469DRAFT_738544 [Zopfia rhizophila CBS 207.26]
MSSESSTPKTHHNMLLTHLRTSSHLLNRLLSLPSQPYIHQQPSDGYFFLEPTSLRFRRHIAGKNVSTWTDEQKRNMKEAFQRSYESLENWMREAESVGKKVFVKDHVLWMVEPVSETRFLHGIDSEGEEPFTDRKRSERNETCFPDTVLKKWKPTFLIRHPALAFPSSLRTSIENEGLDVALKVEGVHAWEMKYHWSRVLYDWYATSLAPTEKSIRIEGVEWPIVLDADDIQNPSLVKKYATIAGLDPERSSLSKISKMEKKMKSTILGSSGIVPEKTAEGLDLEREREKWKVEFGGELGKKIRQWVDRAVEDYEYLKERRLRV